MGAESPNPRARGRREGGRSARRSKREAKTASPAIWAGVSSGHYKPLSDSAMDKVHAGALELLATLGISNAPQDLRDIVLPKGCFIRIAPDWVLLDGTYRRESCKNYFAS